VDLNSHDDGKMAEVRRAVLNMRAEGPPLFLQPFVQFCFQLSSAFSSALFSSLLCFQISSAFSSALWGHTAPAQRVRSIKR